MTEKESKNNDSINENDKSNGNKKSFGLLNRFGSLTDIANQVPIKNLFKGTKDGESYTIYVHIMEARDLKGKNPDDTLDPVCSVKILGILLLFYISLYVINIVILCFL